MQTHESHLKKKKKWYIIDNVLCLINILDVEYPDSYALNTIMKNIQDTYYQEP